MKLVLAFSLQFASNFVVKKKTKPGLHKLQYLCWDDDDDDEDAKSSILYCSTIG